MIAVEAPSYMLCSICLGTMVRGGTCGCEAYSDEERFTLPSRPVAAAVAASVVAPPAAPATVIRIEAVRAMRERADLQEELARHKHTKARLGFTSSPFLDTRLGEIDARLRELDAVICGRRA